MQLHIIRESQEILFYFSSFRNSQNMWMCLWVLEWLIETKLSHRKLNVSYVLRCLLFKGMRANIQKLAGVVSSLRQLQVTRQIRYFYEHINYSSAYFFSAEIGIEGDANPKWFIRLQRSWNTVK